MKKILLALSLFSALSLTACEKLATPAEEEQKQENNENDGNGNNNGGTPSGNNDNTGKKVLVAYFSFTNTTKGFATTIAEIAGADVYEIVPEVAYGSENSNYYDESTRAYKEQKNTGGEQRPAIKKTLENADSYDVIFLGHPIWYSKAPRVIFTFLDAYGFKGKKVVEFVTSASTGITTAESELKETYKDITWGSGRKLNGSSALSEDELKAWVNSNL